MTALYLNYRADFESDAREAGLKILEYFDIPPDQSFDLNIDPHCRAYAIVSDRKGTIISFVCVGAPGNQYTWQRDLPYGGLMVMLYKRLNGLDTVKPVAALKEAPKKLAQPEFVTVMASAVDCSAPDESDLDI